MMNWFNLLLKQLTFSHLIVRTPVRAPGESSHVAAGGGVTAGLLTPFPHLSVCLSVCVSLADLLSALLVKGHTLAQE